jgi:hypothetical protein
VVQDQVATLDSKGHQVFPGPEVKMAAQAQQDRKVLKDFRVHQDNEETQVQQDHLDLQGLMDGQGTLVSKVSRGHKECLAHLEHLGL